MVFLDRLPRESKRVRKAFWGTRNHYITEVLSNAPIIKLRRGRKSKIVKAIV